MKLVILGLLSVILSTEAFAQIRRTPQAPRGPRYNPPTRVQPAPRPIPGRVVVVGPRYVPNRHSTRVIRTTRRAPVVWSRGFGYACTPYGELLLNRNVVHSFRYSSDCSQALSDIRNYGDFCDNEDLYDQSGYLQAQFTFNYECREALGYYY